MSLLTLGRRFQAGVMQPGSIASIIADVGTPASTTETDLASLTLPSSLLDRNGAVVRFSAVLRTAANANTKRAKVIFGGTTILDTAATADNAAVYRIEGMITRRTSATQEVVVSFTRGATVVAPTRTAATIDLTAGGPAFKVTGTNGTATANDLVLSQLTIEKVV